MQLESLGPLIQKGAILLVSFLDDIAIFALTRLGLYWSWLHWLSTVLLIATLIYWSFRLYRYYDRIRGQN
ncbi:hypothetical protein [Leptothoe spongobia]|uniref:Uncharacterized protein n=1 Tax=Leptothoe spongobia TAU-MAC 1115 TaxID=1967444 RepID=A0A947GRQ8_9CYAN|nr:hypothetical protein [Leptothoe spongobia]MBT9317591.1 hypothetical protein [Leptothoe spongobia TAU-MAC 1115]